MIKYLILIGLLFFVGCMERTTYREKEMSVSEQKQRDPGTPAIVPMLKVK